METSAERQPRFRCSVCQQGFTRTDHLKRHQLRHTGIKPYTCTFCKEAFARVDSLRNHYPDCGSRGDHPIPETDQKGRRRHACKLCTSMKLRCEGEGTCSACQKRGVECVRPQNAPAKAVETNGTSGPQTPSRTPDRTADLGSIKFLLNGGTEGFMEDFQFPARVKHTSQSDANEDINTSPQGPAIQPGPAVDGTAPLPVAYGAIDQSDMAYLNQNFFSFFGGPFDAFHQQQWQQPFPPTLDQNILPFAAGPSPTSSDTPSARPTDNLFDAILREYLLTVLSKITLQPLVQQGLISDIHFLITPKRLRHFCSLYFKHWQPNCPLIHQPSFDPERAELPLLTSVVFMGAMYSHDMRERMSAKNLLDVAELSIFSTDAFSDEAEMSLAYEMDEGMPAHDLGWPRFQHFIAAYLIVVLQYWAGHKISKHRAMERGFGEIIKMCRRFGLPGCRHTPEDAMSPDLWLKQEIRIRAINIIWSLDIAFLFFQNYPLRFTFAELRCDLPCDEEVFAAPNPFEHPAFAFSRNMTLGGALQALFTARLDPQTADGVTIHAVPGTNWLNLSVLDMFHLMHIIYVFIHVELSTAIPLLDPRQPAASGKPSTAVEDPKMQRIQQALNCWRDIWTALRQSEAELAKPTQGLFRNAYNYFLVCQLLINKKDYIDAGMLLEPKCENKLERMKVLT